MRYAIPIGLLMIGLLGASPSAFGESDEPPTQQELQERIAQLLKSTANNPATLVTPRRQLTESDFRAGRSALIPLPATTIAPRQLGGRDVFGNRPTLSGSSSTPTFPRRQLSERDFLGRR